MKTEKPITANIPINILVADDDSDDRHFFERALSQIPIPTKFSAVADGEKLMTFLHDSAHQLPDLLFLDLNMPRKNGFECLAEIRLSEKLRSLPVIILSTSFHYPMAQLLYNNGAFRYIRKTNLADLQVKIEEILNMVLEQKLSRPEMETFLLDSALS